MYGSDNIQVWWVYYRTIYAFMLQDSLKREEHLYVMVIHHTLWFKDGKKSNASSPTRCAYFLIGHAWVR